MGGRKPQGFITVKDGKTGEKHPVPVFKPSKKPGKVRRRFDMREYASSVEVQEIVRFLARTLSDNPRTAQQISSIPGASMTRRLPTSTGSWVDSSMSSKHPAFTNAPSLSSPQTMERLFTSTAIGAIATRSTRRSCGFRSS